MKKKSSKIIATIVIILILITTVIYVRYKKLANSVELKKISSVKELETIYEGGDFSTASEILIKVFGMPFTFFADGFSRSILYEYDTSYYRNSSSDGISILDLSETKASSSKAEATSKSSKDYSTTNIQVENVDEADITKTDGDYIYSISENNVIITNVMSADEIKITSKIAMQNNCIPEELIIYKDKLVVIATKFESTSQYSYYNKSNTLVNIYDITNREMPKMIKNYELYEPYYTTRCIDSKLYVIASGMLREDDNVIITYFKEDNKQKEIKDISYLKEIKTRQQTLLSTIDLNDVTSSLQIKSYLIDISNAYISENNIYLANKEYDRYSDEIPLSTLFGLKGALGPFLYENQRNYTYGYNTTIYKFNLQEDGTIKYDTKASVKGSIVNQFSLDEYNENLRIALYDNDGTRVVILDKNLKNIGETEYLAKGEKMYSSRFLGNKAYLVTYKIIDPLYVIDLSEPTNPTVLGEFKIPGYSTYLHPYDETHLIGIGMETEEVINRNTSGKVTSVTAKITGMKMALFDVADVNNPKQISNTVIGDSRASSAILTNHKALLFSKEKELIAIPVNNYEDDFEKETTSDNYESLINLYTNYEKKYVSEGYFVYNINLTDGFKLKGIINHEKTQSNYYWYGQTSKLLRGLYIEDNLYTISEDKIKVNKLDDLTLIKEINIKGE